MIQPATLPLKAHRHAPFDLTISVVGLDLTGATAVMQVRLYPDAAGAALIDLVSTGAAASKLDLGAATVDGEAAGTIRIRITKAAVAALPAAAESGDDVSLAYDIHVTPLGETEGVYFRGDFIVLAGVTQ